MSIRRDPIYISSEVHRWLRLLAKSEVIPSEKRDMVYQYTGIQTNTPTADEIADQILRQAIREQHPTLADLQKQIKKLEDETIEQLRVDNAPKNEIKQNVPAQP